MLLTLNLKIGTAKMRPIATDVAWVDVSVCVCLLDATVSVTKTAEPIEMPFELWTRTGPRNHALVGGLDPPRKGAVCGVVPLEMR